MRAAARQLLGGGAAAIRRGCEHRCCCVALLLLRLSCVLRYLLAILSPQSCTALAATILGLTLRCLLLFAATATCVQLLNQGEAAQYNFTKAAFDGSTHYAAVSKRLGGLAGTHLAAKWRACRA